jgi:hypothetical protein
LHDLEFLAEAIRHLAPLFERGLYFHPSAKEAVTHGNMKFIKIDNNLYNCEKLMALVEKKGQDNTNELVLTFSDGKSITATPFERECILHIIRPPEETPDERVVRSELARLETKNDLEKSIEQLVTDVHHGAFDPSMSEEHKILYGTRRMISMMGRVAKENEKTSRSLVRLTRIIIVLIVPLVLLSLPPAVEVIMKLLGYN